MHRKTLASGILLLFLIGTVYPVAFGMEITQEAKGDVLYVGGSGPGNYTRIQDAIDAATNGDTVFVYSGTYNEVISIDKYINVYGEDKTSTIIDGMWLEGSTVRIEETGVNSQIRQFTINNIDVSQNGVLVYGNNAKISDIIVSNPEGRHDGVSIWEADGVLVENCSMTDGENHEAYAITSSENCIINNCTSNSGNIWLNGAYNCKILNSTFRNSLYGIEGYPNNLLVQNCFMIDPKIQGVSLMGGGNNNRFVKVTILNAGSNGMYISSQQENLRFQDCIISGCEDDGIIFWGRDQSLLINNCTFENNGMDGVHFYQGWRWGEVSGCRFINNTYGIGSYGKFYLFGRFLDNTFMNKEAEIYLYRTPNLGINKFSGNYWGDYIGVDNDGDGFGDTPYHVFGLLNWDFNPRMTPLPMGGLE